MTRWADQLAKHAIHTTLNEAREFVESEHEGSSPEQATEKRRFLKILDEVEAVLGQIDAEVAPLNLLDNLNNGIRHQNVWNEIASYASNGNADHLVNANNNITAQLPALIQLATFSREPVVTKQLKTLEKSVSAFTATIDAKTNELSESVEEVDRERTVAGQELNELKTAVEAKKTEVDQLTTSWKQEFSNAQTERANEYEAWRKSASAELEKKSDELIKSNSTKLTAANEKFGTEISGLIGDAEEKHQKILELHEIVAGDSVAAGYLQNAKKEKEQANFWRWASIIFIVATAAWTGVAYFWAPGSNDANGLSYWGQVLKAFSVAGVLLFGAVYSSKQSNLHRKIERKTRWFALEVKAIDPFIASLKPEEQTELKKALSEKLFGRIEPDGDDDNAINEHMLSSVAKVMTDVIKASKS